MLAIIPSPGWHANTSDLAIWLLYGQRLTRADSLLWRIWRRYGKLARGQRVLVNGAVVQVKVSWAANAPEGTGGTLILGTKGGLQLRPLTLVRNLAGYQVDVTPPVP